MNIELETYTFEHAQVELLILIWISLMFRLLFLEIIAKIPQLYGTSQCW